MNDILTIEELRELPSGTKILIPYNKLGAFVYLKNDTYSSSCEENYKTIGKYLHELHFKKERQFEIFMSTYSILITLL